MAPTVIDPNDLSGALQSMSDRLDVLEKIGAIPVGLVAFCGGDVPDGFLLCNGGAFDGTRYGQLAQYLGGTTLPSIAGKVIVGQNAATFATLMSTGGVETVALTTAQMPAHGHSVTITDPGHSHTGIPVPIAQGSSPNSINAGSLAGSTSSAFTGISAVAASNGSGTAHTNLQPYCVLVPIIKF